MVGLALSMGATGLVLPRQSDGAAAAEASGTEATVSPVSQAVAPAVPEASAPDSFASASTQNTAQHTVVAGETLHRIARKYQVTVEAIAQINKLSTRSVLQVGQVLKIPARINTQPSAEDSKVAENKVAVDTLLSERQEALEKLRVQREQLESKLMALRPESSQPLPTTAAAPEERQALITDLPPTADNAAAKSTSAQELPETVASLPASLQPQAAPQNITQPTLPSAEPQPDWIRSNQDLLMPSSQATGEPSTQESVVALRPTAQPTVPQITPEMATYRVSPGDTVARIARAHSISPSELISANRISDPNFIFVGQVLQIPGGQANREATVSRPEVPIAAQTEIQLPAQVASISPAVPTMEAVTVPTIPAPAVESNLVPQQVAAAPLSNSPAAPTPESLTLPAPSQVSTSASNPFVQNLMAEINTMRQRYQSDSAIAANAAAPQTEIAQPVAVPAAPTAIAAASGATAINPQFQRRAETAEASPSVPTVPPVSQPQTVAVAPLGSETYEPLLRPVTGRMVSPDLPPLPGADNFLPNQREVFDGYIWPTRGIFTSGYGWRWGRMHRGIDIANDVGTPIHAAADGVVQFAGWNSGGYGNMIDIRHADGSMTRYAHLNRVSVRVGQQVDQNQLIGEMGSTGFSTGPHLHFEVHLANQGTVNPISLLPSR